MKPSPIVLALLAGVLLCTAPASALVSSKFSFRVVRAPHPMALDPNLSDPAWEAGRVPDGDGGWENVTTRSAAQFHTAAYLLYDDRFLYIAFRAEQAGTPVVATQTTNDVGFGIDDFVGIGIDTSGAGSQAYFFETTPRGVRYEQANENARYQPRWRAAAVVRPGGWNAVMIVPLSALKIARSGTQPWRVEFVRQVAALGEHYAWAYSGLMADAPAGSWPAFVDSRWWASTTGVQLTVAQSRGRGRADLYGLLNGGWDRNQFQQANGTFVSMPARNYGLDVSYPITPTTSFVGTANPDFSNVEIDQQTIAPQEFRRALTEYRPFFAQGANFINASSGSRTTAVGSYSTSPNVVFYSPTVGPFDWGAKVEGANGLESFGALTFRGFDATTGNTFNDQAYGFEHSEPDGSFLYWSDGVLAHHSLAGTDDTIETGAEVRNYGSDLIWFFDHSFESGTWVPQGHADLTQFFVDEHRTNYEVNAGYLGVSPNYNPIDGFTSNSDIHGPQAYVGFFGSTRGIKNWSVITEADRFTDLSGAVHQADFSSFVTATFKNGFSLDGAGEAIGQLRSYDVPAGPSCSGPIVAQTPFTGYPCYLNGSTARFTLAQIPIGYGDGTPSPVDASYSWGPFGANYTHLFTLAANRPIFRTISLGLAYDGTYERPFGEGSLNSQWLRSISLGMNISANSSLTVALRDINGTGGFATQLGNNLAVGYHARFRSGDELYANYGSPAAGATLNRFILKYIFHEGSDTGT